MEEELYKLLKSSTVLIKSCQSEKELDSFFLSIFGSSGKFSVLVKKLKDQPNQDKPTLGKLVNQIKSQITKEINHKRNEFTSKSLQQEFDVTLPAQLPPLGHLHLVTQAIEEITRIFERIGFTRVRYPEVEWDWYAFESLNMPKNHPARDDIESFYLDTTPSFKYGKMVLSPHTSSGQVREMERVKSAPPIRMINIAKCYRPNWDINHTPMFYQFEGLVVDHNINIAHLKGTMDYFAQEFFGKSRKTRLRPFHFQFTEPSFEVDITCGICEGLGNLPDGNKCRYCKEGWLELGGSGMVHPNVLIAGKIDPDNYSGFAFGWGIERTYMMKAGTNLDDNRLMYTNDIRFLEQF